MSDIRVLEQRALEIRRRYDDLNRDQDGQAWDVKKLAHGFKKDVQELLELIERKSKDEHELSHELGDCLWSVLVIARKLDIDIEKAFWTTMGELDNRLDRQLK